MSSLLYVVLVVQSSLPGPIRDGRGVKDGSFRSFNFEPFADVLVRYQPEQVSIKDSQLTTWGRGVATDQPVQARQPGSCLEHCQRVCGNALLMMELCKSHSDV